MSANVAKTPTGREEPPPKPRRFYTAVSITKDAGIWCVTLDGKPVRTPMKKPLGAPQKALAEALAEEWDAQSPVIDRDAMPLTRLVSTAIDRVAVDREAVIEGLMSYVDADLLCYRASYPTELKARQDRAWQPVLDWLRDAFAADLAVGEGVMPVSQSPKAVKALRAAIEELSDEQLTAFQACAASTKSLALSMALIHSRLSSEGVALCAHLDESFQAEQWGEDKEALGRRRGVEAEIQAIGTYLRLLT